MLIQNVGGMASASSGDIFKLTFLVGKFSRVCDDQHNCKFRPLEVNEWKGQMSKDLVSRRVANCLNIQPDAYGNHIMDSVGMGLFVKGVLSLNGKTRKK